MSRAKVTFRELRNHAMSRARGYYACCSCCRHSLHDEHTTKCPNGCHGS